MKLKTWLAIEGISGVEFAEMVDVTDGAVTLWKDGSRIPRPAQMQKIVEVTKGKVKAQDFYS